MGVSTLDFKQLDTLSSLVADQMCLQGMCDQMTTIEDARRRLVEAKSMSPTPQWLVDARHYAFAALVALESLGATFRIREP